MELRGCRDAGYGRDLGDGERPGASGCGGRSQLGYSRLCEDAVGLV